MIVYNQHSLIKSLLNGQECSDTHSLVITALETSFLPGLNFVLGAQKVVSESEPTVVIESLSKETWASVEYFPPPLFLCAPSLSEKHQLD